MKRNWDIEELEAGFTLLPPDSIPYTINQEEAPVENIKVNPLVRDVLEGEGRVETS